MTSTLLTLVWTPLSNEDSNGVIQYYAVAVVERDSRNELTGNTFTVNTENDTSSLTIDNLHPYYIYECAVAGYTISLGPFSDEIRVQLDEDSKPP